MSLLDTASLIVTPNAYKASKLYSVIPSDGSGDMSVTRATTATRVNSAGLVELVPYNLAGYSEQFQNAYWVKQNTTITANVVAAPNGTLTADRIVSSAGINSYLYRVFSFTIGTTYTLSFYVKADYAQTIRLYGYSVQTNLDVTTEWTRISITFVATTESRDIGIRGNSSGINFDIYIWGAQLVEGTSARDYFATETRLNIPRLDYSLGSCPSILVEPQRTNQYTKSEDFNGWSSKTLVTTTADYSISPSGILNADRLQFTGSGFLHNAIAQVSATQYTVSCYAKRNDSGTQSVGFFVNGTGTVDSAWSLTNEWQRFTYTYTASNNSQTGIAGLIGADVSVFGFQREVGAYATSYIPTTSASVTRNADAISKTGISSLIGQTEGTLFLDFEKTNNDNVGLGGYFRIDLNDGTTNNRILFGFDLNNINATVISGGTVNVSISTTGVQTQTRIKAAFSYKANDFILYVNGVQIGVDLSGLVPSGMANLQWGVNQTTPTQTSGIINATALWKTRLTNAQLAQLTTI